MDGEPVGPQDRQMSDLGTPPGAFMMAQNNANDAAIELEAEKHLPPYKRPDWRFTTPEYQREALKAIIGEANRVAGQFARPGRCPDWSDPPLASDCRRERSSRAARTASR